MVPPPSRSPRLGQSRVLLHPSWLPGSGSWVGVGYFKCKPLTLRKHWKKLAPPTFSVSEAQKKLVGPTFSKISTIFLETSWKSRNWWKKLAPPTFSEPEVREKLVGPAFSKIFTIFLEASWESRNWWKKLAPPTFSTSQAQKKLVGSTCSTIYWKGFLCKWWKFWKKVGSTNFFLLRLIKSW